MGKMKELAYTVERLDHLFRYLDLLSEVNKSFGFTHHVIMEKMVKVCNEIEIELEIDKGIKEDK